MSVVIEPFDVSESSEVRLAGCIALRQALRQADLPGGSPLSRADALDELRGSDGGPGRADWAAIEGGRVVGSLGLLREGEAATRAEVLVHPQARRRGVGTELLRFATARIEDDGGKLVTAILSDPDEGVTAWIGRVGFREIRRTLMQVLPVKSTSPRLWRSRPPFGYRLQQWNGAVPENLLESYAAARRALRDAPSPVCVDPVSPSWSADSIREAERALAAAGTEQWVSVAVDKRTGEIVAASAILRYPGRAAFGYVDGTSVVPAHRGRGLGRIIKGAHMHWVRGEHPELDWIMSCTDAENSHMNAVNRALGYRVAKTVVSAEAPVVRLAERLARLP